MNCRQHIFTVTLVLLLCISFFCDFSYADTVTRRQAEALFDGWRKTDDRPFNANLGKKIKKTDCLTDDAGDVFCYLISLDDGGFVVVAGDDQIEPVICFSASNGFDPNGPLQKILKRDISKRRARLQQLRRSRNSRGLADLDKSLQDIDLDAKEKSQKWATLMAYADGDAGDVGVLGIGTGALSEVRVDPIIQSQWGQFNTGGYSNTLACANYYTGPYPDGDNRNYPCGCVALAMAQMMKYYEYPSGYSYSDMPLVPDIYAPQYQRQAIGLLCFDAAEAIDTIYGSTGSSAYIDDCATQFKSAFNYDNAIHSLNPSSAERTEMINPNLDAGRPVILGLDDGSDVGHAVVCDGYGYSSTTIYHHINMGWDGDENAWYALPTVDTVYGTFNGINAAVYNVFVDESGEILSGRVVDISGNPIPGVTVSTGAYSDVTDTYGVYALTALPSNNWYTVTAVKPPFTFNSQLIYVGSSNNGTSTTGNVWAVNFASTSEAAPTAYDQTVDNSSGAIDTITLTAIDEGLPNPPGVMKYIVTSLPQHGWLSVDGVGQITNVPYEIPSQANTVDYQSCIYYGGSDSFQFCADDYGSSPTGGISSPATVTIDVNNIVQTYYGPDSGWTGEWPLQSDYQQARTQIIYLASQVGPARVIDSLAMNVDTLPGLVLNDFTIRVKHTSRETFSSPPYFESGWTTVYQNDENINSKDWYWFNFTQAFEYNGTDNLIVDISFNNSNSADDPGMVLVSNQGTGVTRVLMCFADGTHGDPLDWTDSYHPAELRGSTASPNIKISGINMLPVEGDIEGDCDVDFFDFAFFADAWLTEDGDPDYNLDCDIATPKNDKIDADDLQTFAEDWLTPAE